jgi:hypothetical protein
MGLYFLRPMLATVGEGEEAANEQEEGVECSPPNLLPPMSEVVDVKQGVVAVF